MKKAIIVFIIFATLISITLNSCSSLEEMFFGEGEQPIDVSVSVSDAEIISMSMTGVKVAYNIKVENLNDSKVEISSCDYAFSFKDSDSEYTGTFKDSIKMKNNKEEFTVTEELSFVDLAKSINIFNYSEVDIALDGNISLRSASENKSVPITATGIVPVPKMPKVMPGKMDVKGADFTKAILSFELNIDNPNPFPIDFTPHYAVKLNDKNIVSVSEGKSIIAQPESSTNESIDVTVDYLMSVSELMTANKFDVTFDGGVEFDSFAGVEDVAFEIVDDFLSPMLPGIDIAGVDVKMGFLSADLILKFKVTNNNDKEEIEIRSWNFSAYLDNTALVESYSLNSISINPNDSEIIPLTIGIDPVALASGGLSGGDFSVNMAISVKSLIGGEDFDFNYSMDY